MQCLAAGKPTVISDLAHLVDIPAIDPRGRRASPASAEPIAIAVDLLDEHDSLPSHYARWPTTRGCATRWDARDTHLGVNHTIDVMVRDYEHLIERAAASPVPTVADLPAAFHRRSLDARARDHRAAWLQPRRHPLLRRAADDKKKPLSALSTQRYFVLCDLGDLRGFFPIVCGQRDSHS